MKKVLVSASILSSDFSNLYYDVNDVVLSGSDWIHYDVMDGNFVNNISFGVSVISSISFKINAFNDIHLMINEPLKYLDDFLKCNPNLITLHYETIEKNKIKNIKEYLNNKNVKLGISIKPNTDIPYDILNDIDLILVMSVEPGFGGQKFIDSSLEKIKKLAQYREKSNLFYLIEVDGGINQETGNKCVKAGADVLVSGSYIFKAKDRKEAINKFKELV